MKRSYQRNLIILVVIIVIGLIVMFIKSKDNIIMHKAFGSITDDSYFLFLINNEDPKKDSFIEYVRSLAEENGIKNIYAQTIPLNDLQQPTALYQYVNGEINRVVYSDQEKQAVKNFFENKNYIPSNSEFGMFKHGDITIAVKDIILPHLITNRPENFTKEYLKNYAITFKYYVYNNNQIRTHIENEIPDFIPDYFVLKDHFGNVIKTFQVSASQDTSMAYKGDRIKATVSYDIPGNDIKGVTLYYKFANKSIPLTDLKVYNTINDMEMDF